MLKRRLIFLSAVIIFGIMALLWGFAFNVPLNVHNRKGEGEESGKGGAWVGGGLLSGL